MDKEELEQKLKELTAKMRGVGGSVIYVFLVGFALMIVFGVMKQGLLGAGVFAVMVCYVIYYASQNDKNISKRSELQKEISRIYLPEIVKPELDRSFDNVTVDTDRGIDAYEFDNFGLFAVHDIYFTSDRIEADFNGIHFYSAYSRVMRHHTAKGSQSNTDLTFSGRSYVIELPFSVASPVRIINDKLGGEHGVNAYRFQVKRFGREQRFFEEEFSKYFHVYSDSDGDTARALSPIMQETLVQVRDELFYIPNRNTNDLRRFRMALCFFGNKLCVQVENELDGFRMGRRWVELDEKVSRIDKQIGALKLILDAVDSYRT